MVNCGEIAHQSRLFYVRKCSYVVEKHARRSKPFLCGKEMLLSDGKIAHWSKPFLCNMEMLLSEGENVHWNTFF